MNDVQANLIPIIIEPIDIGQVANQVARQTALQDYQARKSEQTLRRQKADIALFEKFLTSAGNPIEELVYDLQRWSIVTWGLVEAFKRWQLQESYATGSINVRLATIKTYCSLATKAGFITPTDLTLINEVVGYRQREAHNTDEKREQTRRPLSKKAESVSLLTVHTKLLKQQPADTQRGRRDALIMCLLLDHALRVSEVADLNVSSINIQSGQLTIYHRKTNDTSIHELSPDTYQTARAYLADCKPDQEPLFLGPKSSGRISTRTINQRVGILGKKIGIDKLSPHDCRHFAAEDAFRNGTDIKSLQDFGNWKCPAMPLRYAKSAKIANSGVKLSAYKGKDTVQ